MRKERWKDEELYTMAANDEERRDFALSFAYQYYDLYDKGVTTNYWWFTGLTIATLLGSALAPMFAAFKLGAAWIALPSALAGFAAAMNSAFHFQEQWIQGYSAVSALDLEIVRFRERSGPDYGPDKDSAAAVTSFQRKITEIVSAEVKKWGKSMGASARPKVSRV
jgi:hypothetical protein